VAHDKWQVRSAQGALGGARGLGLARYRKVGQHYPYSEAFADSRASPSTVRAHTITLEIGPESRNARMSRPDILHVNFIREGTRQNGWFFMCVFFATG
jgi:hypothetical protein